MSIPAASGALTLPEKHLAAMLADCPAFQTMVGVDEESATPAADALAKVYFDAFPPPADPNNGYSAAENAANRPCALVYVDQEAGYHLALQGNTGGLHDFSEGGQLKLQLDWLATAELWADEQAMFRTFKNKVGDLLYELADRAGGTGFLAIRGIKVTQIARIHDKEVDANGFVVSVFCDVTWDNGRGQ